jgi:bifunctional non-homologous end joining protein LigD
MVCRVSGGKARFISRTGKDWTAKFPELADAAGGLEISSALLDGEVVALKPDGTSSFQALQQVFETGRTGELVYYVFDMLYVDGHDVTALPLESRRELVRRVLSESHESIRYSESIHGSGSEVLEKACALDLEGILCKRLGSPYRPGRGLDWLKVKCSKREEFVIGGFTSPGGSRAHFGALLLGYYNDDRKLIYAGRVGTGFSDAVLSSLHGKLAKLVRRKSPFSDLSGSSRSTQDVSWVKPELVAEIQFSNWTDEGLLRHPSFQGLREDKPASKVVHADPLSLSDVRTAQARVAAGAVEQHGASRSATISPSGGSNRKRVKAARGEYGGVVLTHPDKVMYPDSKVTKRDLAEYYARVADWMLPHVIHRPLAIVRCPDGTGKACFFQKHPGQSASEHLQMVNVAQGRTAEYHLAIDDLSGLISLVQMGVLEIHVWGSRVGHLEKPDRLIFDLDPDPSVGWQEVISAALSMRLLFQEMGLSCFLKTTGGKGLHLVVPIQARTEWGEAKGFCRAVADFMVRTAPDRFVATMSKAARKGKIFIDYLRNGRGATAIAPYSTRNRPGATVSVPIGWEELTAELRSDHFTIENVPARLDGLKKDPWTDLAKTKQSITAARMRRLTH